MTLTSDTFRPSDGVARLARWLPLGLALSLFAHGGMFVAFQHHRLEKFGAAEAPRLAPPRIQLKQVTIDPKTLEAEPEVTRVTVTERRPVAIELPTEKPEVESEVRVIPQVVDLTRQLVPEKPKVDAVGLDNLARMATQSRGAMDRELDSLAGSLLKDTPKSARQPTLRVPQGSTLGEGGIGSAEGIPGTRTLDEALASTGPLTAGGKSIGMEGGALFEYDSYDLRPEAVEQLRKLGTLIQRNPTATFSIEGHTDSFGTPDYNLRLSERRAESVKIWLVELMGLTSDRIQTRGFGNTRWIVAPEKDKDAQAPNRRVELVVKTNRR